MRSYAAAGAPKAFRRPGICCICFEGLYKNRRIALAAMQIVYDKVVPNGVGPCLSTGYAVWRDPWAIQKRKKMPDVLPYGLLLIGLILVCVISYPAAMRVINSRKKLPGVVKRDWLPTGRIDFATQLNADAKDNEKPTEFKLLVEERRIVESIAGNENLEIQWRLANLREAKAVVSQYHSHLSESPLIKSIPDDPGSAPPPMAARDSLSEPA